MVGKNERTGNRALSVTASVFGVLAGIGGLTHAIGEISQGNVRPEGLMIDSWTEGPIAARMGGDPGMTIIPNLLLTGIVGAVVSLAVVVWAAFFVRRKHGGRNLILLSVAMMLFGGGFGSPIIGILAGIAGTGIHSPLTGWRRRLSGGLGRFLAALWPPVLAVSAVNGAFLMGGAIILIYFFDWGNATLFLNSFYFAVISLLLTILTGVAYDTQKAQESELSVAM